MLAKLLSSRIIDILLIAAALYFLLPGVRRFFTRRKAVKANRYTVITQDKHHGAGHHQDTGKYIDYEEVK